MNRQQRRSIEVTNVTFAFGSQPILDDINITIAPGQCIALLGRSGVGKSTLLNLLAGFVRPSSGNISPTPLPRQTAFLFQSPTAMPWLNAMQNVQAAIDQHRGHNSGLALQSLQCVGLAEAAQKFPWELSGGMLKRLALASVLSMKRSLILLDEPTSGLDDWTKELVLRLVRDEVSAEHSTCVFTTHSFRDAATIADRVLYLAGSPAQIRLDYSTERTIGPPEETFIVETSADLRRRIEEVET